MKRPLPNTRRLWFGTIGRHMRKGGHTSVRRGKRVRVTMMNGDQFVDTFVSSSKGAIQLRDRGEIQKKSVATISIYKPLPHEIKGWEGG